jgi:phage protein D
MSSTGAVSVTGTGIVPAPAARVPMGVVLINGTQVPWESWRVSNNGFFRADTFDVVLPLTTLPQGLRVSDLSNMNQIMVEVRLSVDGSSPTSLILGLVEPFEVNWPHGEITLTGKDLSTKFLNTKTASSFQNQTSSQVIEQLAASQGLTANAQATTTPIGKYYQIDHNKLTAGTTQWDLITYLAQKEDFYAWVSGTTLNFQPSSVVQGTPISVQWDPATMTATANGPVVSLKTTRNLLLASDVKVVVDTWNHRQKAKFRGAVTATKTGKSNGAPSTLTYHLRSPGLTSDAAQAAAQAQAEQITRHERLFEMETPPDVTTTPRNQVQISGTGTSWDQSYWIDVVDRSMRWGEFTQTVSGKNHSPQSMAGL